MLNATTPYFAPLLMSISAPALPTVVALLSQMEQQISELRQLQLPNLLQQYIILLAIPLLAIKAITHQPPQQELLLALHQLVAQ